MLMSEELLQKGFSLEIVIKIITAIAGRDECGAFNVLVSKPRLDKFFEENMEYIASYEEQ